MLKVYDMVYECFELIKKRQQKRIQKRSKIIDLESRMEELDPQEDEEDLGKLEDQKTVILEDIVDTIYVPCEDRIGEELTLSRAIDNISILLRFIQLLCENHNYELQMILNTQVNADGRQKMR